MQSIANLLFEARILKEVPRSGYQFLGAGQESVAEHTFSATFIAFVMSQLIADCDGQRLMAMCLVHDLAEARTGDLNYVHKEYVTCDETKALFDATAELPFGETVADLVHEYNAGQSLESRLAHDADQLSFILELKYLSDIGYLPPKKWMPDILKRLKTAIGKKLAQAILNVEQDAWWLKKIIDKSP
jgi:putative hydrolase of HD superfamily